MAAKPFNTLNRLIELFLQYQSPLKSWTETSPSWKLQGGLISIPAKLLSSILLWILLNKQFRYAFLVKLNTFVWTDLKMSVECSDGSWKCLQKNNTKNCDEYIYSIKALQQNTSRLYLNHQSSHHTPYQSLKFLSHEDLAFAYPQSRPQWQETVFLIAYHMAEILEL